MSIAPNDTAFSPQHRSSIPEEAVAILAHLAWHTDGCPSDRQVQYLREAEVQLRATHYLLRAELAVPLAPFRRHR